MLSFLSSCVDLFSLTFSAIWAVSVLRFFLLFLLWLSVFYLVLAFIHTMKRDAV